MKFARLAVVLGLALTMLLAHSGSTRAQNATPEGTPSAECVAPELPPGTPTMASPVADEGMDMGMQNDEPPVAEGPASRNIAAAAEAALANLALCLNSGNYAGVAALMSPNMITFLAGTENPYDVAAAFEAAPPAPFEVLNVSSPIIDTNNRVGLTIVYRGIFTIEGVQTPEKWYFVRDNGVLKLDEVTPATMPADLYPDATIVNVQMVDYAFALDMNMVPAGPVIFHVTNTSYSGMPHVAELVIMADGVTAADIIQADVLPEDQVTAFVNALFLEPGKSGDFYVEDMAAGVYTLVCTVPNMDGTPHWMLGMVAQFTVE